MFGITFVMNKDTNAGNEINTENRSHGELIGIIDIVTKNTNGVINKSKLFFCKFFNEKIPNKITGIIIIAKKYVLINSRIINAINIDVAMPHRNMTCFKLFLYLKVYIAPPKIIGMPMNGILKLAQKMWKDPVNFSTSLNMGPRNFKDKIQVKQLVDKVIKQWGNGEWETVSNLSSNLHEAKLLMLDSTKAKKLLNWKTILSFDEAIYETISWYATFFDKKLDMNKFTLSQIENFSKKIKRMSIINARRKTN